MTEADRADWRRLAGAASAIALVLAMAVYWSLGPAAGFLGHMGVHVVNIGISAPLAGLALSAVWPARRADASWLNALLNAPILAAATELIVVWAWHLPVMNQWAQASTAAFAIEQVSVLAVGILIWAPAVAARSRRDIAGTGAGVVALLITSMHMTLLGALLLFADRPLYRALPAGGVNFCGLPAGSDQIAGATVMLSVLGLLYLGAALALCRDVLADAPGSAGPESSAPGARDA